ncbi:hypothetical protein Tco_1449349 [Tanacetum coccineum]
MEMKDTLSSCSNSEEQQMQQIQDKAKKSCMVSFRQLHSHLKLLSNNNLNGTRTESGFKRAFATLFGQDVETFIDTMFLNMDQLEKQLDKEEFQEIGSMASFKVLETQFQMFIKSRMYMDDEYVVMTRNYFLQYTQLEILEFRDTLIQHMESVKKSIDERAKHKQEYNSWVNERQMQTTEDKVDSSKALDASLVDTESSGTALKEQDTSSRSGNDAHADDADIRPIYDEEPMAEVQTTAEINIFCSGQQHTEKPEFNNEGEVDQNTKQCHDTCPLPAKLTDNKTTELSNQSLESKNICLKRPLPSTLNIHACTSLNPTKEGLRVCSELGIHDHNNEQSSSKLVPKVVPLADKTTTSRQELELLFHHHITMLRIHKDGDGDALFQLKTDSLPYAHAQTTKTIL